MKEIIYIEPATIAKLMGVIVLGLAFLWVIPVEFVLIGQVLKGQISPARMLLPFVMVFIFPGFAYIIGIIVGYLYNFAATRIGGVELYFNEDPDPQ